MKFLHYFDFIHDRKKAHYLIAGLVVIFLLFTAVVYSLPTSMVDIEFSEEVQEDSSPALDALMKAVSFFGVTSVALTLVFGTAISFFLLDHKVEAAFTLLTLVVSLVTFGIKVLINRPRPTADLVNIVEKAQHQSFPSGHTSFYVVFFGFVLFLMLRHRHFRKGWRITIISICGLLIATVPFSRIYLGAHWFTDVAAGFILGLLVLYFLIMQYIKKAHREEQA